MNPQMSQPTRFALTGGPIVLPHEIVSDGAVVVAGNRIEKIVERAALAADMTIIDVDQRYICAGLIDLHIHGAVNRSFNEPTPEAYQAITAHLARQGVTSVLATTTTAPLENLIACLQTARHYMRVQGEMTGAQLLGMHIEGPYFSMEQRGAQDPAHIRTPDDGTPDSLLAYHDLIKIMSYAPELPGALDLTRKLVRLGIVAAGGHSSATDQEVLAAMRNGLSHIIHIWSGQSTVTRDGPWRKPGILEAALTFDNLTVEMISDNKHLPPTLMRLAYKSIGARRLCAISDAISGAGLPNGASFRLGEATYEVVDGVGMLPDRTAFAGSVTLLNRMVPVLTEAVGVPLVDAMRMVTLTPAQVIGVDRDKGSLTPGKDADIVIFESDFSVWRTMIGGRWVAQS
jgi:N-acetylglucosamine-6-phosphate deacetylase